jgi:hypothetical protein
VSARPLIERLVLAVVESLADADPIITIELADKHLSITWRDQ